MNLFIHFGLMLTIAFATFSEADAQSYQALNKVVLIVRQAKTQKLSIYVSRGLSVKSDLEKNEFTFQATISTFLQIDKTPKMRIDSLLSELSFPMLSFKGSLPFNKLDKDISNKGLIDKSNGFCS